MRERPPFKDEPRFRCKEMNKTHSVCSIGAQAAFTEGGGGGVSSSSSSSSPSSPSSKSARCEPRRRSASTVETPSRNPPPHLAAALTAAILRPRVQVVRVRVTERVARSEMENAASSRSRGKREMMIPPPRRWSGGDDDGRRIVPPFSPRLAPLFLPPEDERVEISERCWIANEISTCGAS